MLTRISTPRDWDHSPYRLLFSMLTLNRCIVESQRRSTEHDDGQMSIKELSDVGPYLHMLIRRMYRWIPMAMMVHWTFSTSTSLCIHCSDYGLLLNPINETFQNCFSHACTVLIEPSPMPSRSIAASMCFFLHSGFANLLLRSFFPV